MPLTIFSMKFRLLPDAGGFVGLASVRPVAPIVQMKSLLLLRSMVTVAPSVTVKGVSSCGSAQTLFCSSRPTLQAKSMTARWMFCAETWLSSPISVASVLLPVQPFCALGLSLPHLARAPPHA